VLKGRASLIIVFRDRGRARRGGSQEEGAGAGAELARTGAEVVQWYNNLAT